MALYDCDCLFRLVGCCFAPPSLAVHIAVVSFVYFIMVIFDVSSDMVIRILRSNSKRKDCSKMTVWIYSLWPLCGLATENAPRKAVTPFSICFRMAYNPSRRNFVAYQRGDPRAKGEESLASYRNKTICFLVATAAYTAFLYSSGTDWLFWFVLFEWAAKSQQLHLIYSHSHSFFFFFSNTQAALVTFSETVSRTRILPFSQLVKRVWTPCERLQGSFMSQHGTLLPSTTTPLNTGLPTTGILRMMN